MMKHFFYLFLICMTCAQVSGAQSVSTSLDEYLKLINEGQHSTALYQNVGYLYFQQGDLAEAMLYYEKAAKRSPNNKNIQTAIDRISSELPVQITDIPDFILLRWYRSAASIMSATTWSVLQLLAGIAVLAILYLIFFKRGWTRQLRIALIGTVVLTLLTSLLGWQRYSMETSQSHAVCMELGGIRVAPDVLSEQIAEIGPGNRLYILDQIGEWYKVQLRDKDQGWIHKDAVRNI